jgi:hypothetical protein
MGSLISDNQARREILLRRLFGLDAKFTASDLLLVRDAQDRVAKLASSGEAASRLAV